MLRSLVSTARRQRFVAFLGVVVLALAVPPAFGASSVTTQIAKALKLATKANATATTANTNATKALTLAKSASTGTAGEKGATGAAGPAGPTGATGAAGPKGDTGAAGAKGDKGDTGAPGAPGAPGAKGADGVAKSLSARITTAVNPPVGTLPMTAPSDAPAAPTNPLLSVPTAANTAYVVTAHVHAERASTTSAVQMQCYLHSGPNQADILDESFSPLPYPTYMSDVTLTGLVPATSTAGHVYVTCVSDSGVWAKASLTGVSVAP
jgi:hypothetical protein